MFPWDGTFLERRRGNAAEHSAVSAHGSVDVQVSGCLNMELDHAVRATDVRRNHDVRIARSVYFVSVVVVPVVVVDGFGTAKPTPRHSGCD